MRKASTSRIPAIVAALFILPGVLLAQTSQVPMHAVIDTLVMTRENGRPPAIDANRFVKTMKLKLDVMNLHGDHPNRFKERRELEVQLADLRVAMEGGAKK